MCGYQPKYKQIYFKKGVVRKYRTSHKDPFSLYLSFNDTNDERIEKAREELMEKYKW